MADESTPPGRRCLAITQDGAQCRRMDTGADGFCLVHDQSRREEWKAVQARGLEGAEAAKAAARVERERQEPTTVNDAAPPLERTLEGIVKYLGWVAVQVAAGQMKSSDANSITYAMATLRAALGSRDLEDQLRAAQEKLAAVQAAQKRGVS